MHPAIRSSRLLRRSGLDRDLAPLLLVTGTFWTMLPWTIGGHPPSLCLTGSDPIGRVMFGSAVLLDGGIATDALMHWVVMTGAMMLPLLAPAAKHVHVRSFKRRRLRSQAFLVIGFLATWAAFGFGALALLLAATAWSGAGPWLCVAAMLGAVIWQVSTQRARMMRRCRTAAPLRPHGVTADIDCAGYGASQALACSRTCLPAMYAMSLSPVGHLAALPMAWLMLRERSRPDWPAAWMIALLSLLAFAWWLPVSWVGFQGH